MYDTKMENEFVSVQAVKDLQSTGKQWIEEILGHSLSDNQQIYILVLTPNVEPDATAKRAGLAAVTKIWNRVGSHMAGKEGAGPEFDAAIDEAMEDVRRRDA